MPRVVTADDSREVARLIDAFSTVIGVREPRPFGSPTGRHQGVSDDAQGVQWNCGVDRERGVATIGVNLEGMKYRNPEWPIATLIERELHDPTFPSVAASLADPQQAELWWSRDAWQGAGARPPIREVNIGPEPPVALNHLTTEVWRAMLAEAYECLDPTRGHRGRASQWVTLLHAGRKLKGVSPHLQIKRIIWHQTPTSVDAAIASMSDGRQQLESVYRFVRERTA